MELITRQNIQKVKSNHFGPQRLFSNAYLSKGKKEKETNGKTQEKNQIERVKKMKV